MKKLLLGLAIVLVLLVVAAAAAPFFVDLNRYKDRITALAEEKTGREIKVERIELTVLTGLGAMLRGVEVGGSEKHPEPLLKVGEFQARVAFWPLLAGDIQIAELALTGPEIRVRREADGAFSFDDIVARFKSAPSEGAQGGAAPAEKPKEKSPIALLAGLLVRDLSIQGGLLSYRDASIRPGETLAAELRNLMVSIEDFALDRAAPVSIAFSTPEGESVGVKGKIGPIPESLDAKAIELDTAVELADLQLARWAKWAPKAPVAVDGGTLTADMKLKGSMKTALASAGTLKLAGLAITNKDGKKFGPIDLASDHDLSVALGDETLRIKKGRFTV
ncbi:MAG: AsmA family protein, partial [Candidatus Methylomirabilis sp.]|nr:AsmA family protein [Deltaproteobacteria bacterium]